MSTVFSLKFGLLKIYLLSTTKCNKIFCSMNGNSVKIMLYFSYRQSSQQSGDTMEEQDRPVRAWGGMLRAVHKIFTLISNLGHTMFFFFV